MSITQNCAWPGCGRTFEAERADARYCSPTCRSRASKERKRAEGEGGGNDAQPAAGRVEATIAPPEADGGSGPATPGFRSNLVERFFDLEDRVDDLEFHGEEEQKKLAGLFSLPALIDAVEQRVPSEARIKEWARDEILEEIRALGERVEEMERVLNGPEGVANAGAWIERLEKRVTALEDPGGEGERSVQIRLKQLEAALIGEIERSDIQSENITTLAKLIKRLG